MLRLRSFQSRILFFFLGLFIIVQVVGFFSVYTVDTQSALRHIKEDLLVGGKVFDRLLRSRTEHLFQAASLLSGDFAFKTAFSSGDKPTLISAMDNHRARIRADVMMLVSMEGALIADTLHPESRRLLFPFPGLIKTAEQTGEASSIVFLDERPYQMVVVPLLAPVPVAWICMGFTIDDILAKDMQRLTSLDVTFVRAGPGQNPFILASTLSDPLRKSLSASLPSIAWEPDSTASININGIKYVSLSLYPNKQGDASVEVILQRSMEEALQPFYRLRNRLTILFAGGFFMSLLGGFLISRTVTRPVRVLAQTALSIEQGDYRHPVTIAQQDELGRLASAFNHMMTAIAEREDKIKYQAYYDTLTGLPNRTFLLSNISNAVALAREKKTSFALIIMDLDRFKDINAVLGHNIGDIILKQVGPVLSAAVPESAVIARMGGDEFALLLPDTDGVHQAIALVQKISKVLETPFLIDGNPIQIEASFGIAVYPDHGDDPITLIKLADVAMYMAKGSTSAYSVYSSDLDQHNLRQLTLLGELRLAIEHEELVFFYQPKVDLSSGRITGMEALLRWEHPKHGFIPPDDFIPLLEGTALIKPMTMWTLKAAFSQCSRLNNEDIKLGMAVNLSARMLQEQQIPDYVTMLIEEFNLPPEQIIIEVTESAIMADPERTLNTIKRLDAIGVKLCIDDFGTGYSSMSYLQKLPVDELKIDKSFVLHMDENENDAKIVRSIIDLGHNLGLKTVAEGVERQQTWDMLKSLGCDLAQGYLMSRPIPIVKLMDWIQDSPWGLGSANK